MRKIPCSVGFLTFNSEKTLPRLLESVKDFDDIIFCDGGSTDGTAALAETYGARIIQQDQKFKYANNRLADGAGARNQMIEAARNDWFLMLDSDESISEGLHSEITSIVTREVHLGDALVYDVPICMFVDGRKILYSSNYPGYQPRFYNKISGARYTRAVHNRMDFLPGTIHGTLIHPWYVYVDSKDISIFGAEHKHYRTIEIDEQVKRGLMDYLKFTVLWHLRAAAGIALRSLWIYVRHGFKDSMPLRVEIGRTVGPLMLIVRSAGRRLKRHIQA